MTDFHLLRIREAGLTPAQAEILEEFMAHNLGNALGVVVGETELATTAGRPPRLELIREAVERINWTLEQIRGKTDAGEVTKATLS